MITLTELVTFLCRYDPDFLVEILKIDAEELLARFEDHIEANYDELMEFMEEETEDE